MRNLRIHGMCSIRHKSSRRKGESDSFVAEQSDNRKISITRSTLYSVPLLRSLRQREVRLGVLTNLRGAVDRFGDYLWVDCANLHCIRGRNQFANTKFTRPINKMSKSSSYRQSHPDAGAEPPPLVKQLLSLSKRFVSHWSVNPHFYFPIFLSFSLPSLLLPSPVNKTAKLATRRPSLWVPVFEGPIFLLLVPPESAPRSRLHYYFRHGMIRKIRNRESEIGIWEFRVSSLVIHQRF